MAEIINIYDESNLFEDAIELDGSGNYYSDWLPTNDVNVVRVSGYGVGSGAVTIQHSLSSSNDYFVGPPSALTVASGAFTGLVSLQARYFRLRVDAGAENGTARIGIRAIERL